MGWFMGGAKFKRTRREERSKGKEESYQRQSPHLACRVLTLLSTKSRLLPSVWTAVLLDISSWLSHHSGLSSNSTSSEGSSLSPNLMWLWCLFPDLPITLCVFPHGAHRAHLDWTCLLTCVCKTGSLPSGEYPPPACNLTCCVLSQYLLNDWINEWMRKRTVS